MLHYTLERTSIEHSTMTQILVKFLCNHDKEFLRHIGRKYELTSRGKTFKLVSKIIKQHLMTGFIEIFSSHISKGRKCMSEDYYSP